MDVFLLCLKITTFCFIGGFALAFGIWGGIQLAFECFGPLNIGVKHTTHHYHHQRLPELPEPTL
jgi:hypothetical protein